MSCFACCFGGNAGDSRTRFESRAENGQQVTGEPMLANSPTNGSTTITAPGGMLGVSGMPPGMPRPTTADGRGVGADGADPALGSGTGMAHTGGAENGYTPQKMQKRPSQQHHYSDNNINKSDHVGRAPSGAHNGEIRDGHREAALESKKSRKEMKRNPSGAVTGPPNPQDVNAYASNTIQESTEAKEQTDNNGLSRTQNSRKVEKWLHEAAKYPQMNIIPGIIRNIEDTDAPPAVEVGEPPTEVDRLPPMMPAAQSQLSLAH